MTVMEALMALSATVMAFGWAQARLGRRAAERDAQRRSGPCGSCGSWEVGATEDRDVMRARASRLRAAAAEYEGAADLLDVRDALSRTLGRGLGG